MSTETEKLLSPDEAREKAAQAKKRVTKEVLENPKKEKPVNDRVKAVIENADKQEKIEKQQQKEKDKKLSKENKAVNKAKKKVEEAKKKLEEAKAKNNEKAIKKAEKALEKAKKDLEKAKKAKQEKEKLNLKDAVKKEKEVQKKLNEAGVKPKEDPKKDKKDEKDKENDNKKKKEQTNSNDQKAKLASKINVDGMNIQQHADKYVLVAKNGREIDVTDVMNQIEKYNKGVDAQNAAAKAESAVKSGIDSKAKDMNARDAGLPTNGANGNVIVKGTPELTPSAPAPQQQAAEDIVGKNMPNLDKDEKALVAKTALELSKADLLKDPKAMEKLNERKKENEEKERQKQIRLKQQNVGR